MGFFHDNFHKTTGAFENEVQCYIFGTESTISFCTVPDASVKNLIFDLGGVILDLSVPHTLEAFSQLSGIPTEQVRQIFVGSREFEDYEKGMISDQQFRDFIRRVYLLTNATDSSIDDCWNAMLRGIPDVKLELLETLKKNYNVFLLSNTNGIHLDFINTVILGPKTGHELDYYFHKAYYSHRMLKRKPDAEIFEQVMGECKLKAHETLFLDDNISNLQGASGLGIQTVHVTTPDLVLELFHG